MPRLQRLLDAMAIPYIQARCMVVPSVSFFLPSRCARWKPWPYLTSRCTMQPCLLLLKGWAQLGSSGSLLVASAIQLGRCHLSAPVSATGQSPHAAPPAAALCWLLVLAGCSIVSLV